MYALFKAGQSRRIWGELYKVFIYFITIQTNNNFLEFKYLTIISHTKY